MACIPVVSVVMAVHNGEKYLAEAVESILHQTFADFEFLIIDDGSTDGSVAILSAYAARDARIRLVSQAHCGLTKSLNAGIELAQGEFIARFDADDVSLPDRFDRQVSALRSDPSLVVIGTKVELITDEGLYLGTRRNATEHNEIRKRLLLADGGALTHPAVMIRRSALEAIGGYDETFSVGQDLELFLRLSEIGKLGNLPDTLLLWRQHDTSVNRRHYDTWVPLRQRVIENAINRIGAAEYAKGLVYPEEITWPSSDPVDLGLLAEEGGRYHTAAKLYIRALKSSKLRARAIKRLLVLSMNVSQRALHRFAQATLGKLFS